MAEEEIGARLSLKDRRRFSAEAGAAARDVDNIGDAGKRSSKKMGVAGKAMLGVMAAGGAAALGLAAAAKDAWRQVDDATDTIRVGTGATGAALDGLVSSAHNVAGSVPAAYGDVATAVADLNTRLGITGKPLEDMAAQFLELSRITGTDVATNVANMTRVFGDWGIEAADQAGALDKIFVASQATGIGIDALSQKVVQFGAPLRQMGFSFEESLAMFSKWEKEGVNAELVMGGMRKALGTLAKEGKDAPKEFRRLSEEIKGMSDPTAATSKAIELFGQKAGPDMAAAIREGRFGIDELVATIEGSNETIMAAGADTMDFAERWMMFKNRLVPGLAEIGNGALVAAEGALNFGIAMTQSEGFDKTMAVLAQTWDLVKWAVLGAVEVGQDVTGFLQEHDTFARALAIGLGVILLPTMVRTVWGWGAMGTAAVISAAKQAGAWLLLQVRAIGTGVILGVYYALTVAGWIWMGVTALAQGARIALQWVLMGARAVGAGVVMAVQAALIVGKWILMGAVAMASGVMMAAAWLLGLGPIGLAIAALVAIGAVFVVLWKKSETFRNIVKGALSAVGSAATSVKNEVVTSFNNMVSFFSGLPGRISSATSGMFNGIKNAFRASVNWIVDKWNGLSFSLPSFDTKIPGIGRIGGFSLDTPNIPRLHTGGTVARGGAVNMLPGEEIVILPPAATVVPMSDDVRSMAAQVSGNSGGGGQPIVLQVVLDRKVLAEAVYDHTGDKVARR